MITLFRSIFRTRIRTARCEVVGQQIRAAVAENARKSNELMEVMRQRVTSPPMAIAVNGHKKS